MSLIELGGYGLKYYTSPCVPGFQVVDCIGGVMISLLASCAVLQ